MRTNRRQFLGAAVGAATVFHVPSLLAAPKYDLIIRGGRVIDSSRNVRADVATTRGVIAAVEPHISGEAAETIDATGKLVMPRLIDIHTHATRVKDGPELCLADGVTGWIDAGTQGADGIDQAIARAAPQTGRVLINIGRREVIPEGDTMDLSRADVAAARSAIE